jgi:hypothetical protein
LACFFSTSHTPISHSITIHRWKCKVFIWKMGVAY